MGRFGLLGVAAGLVTLSACAPCRGEPSPCQPRAAPSARATAIPAERPAPGVSTPPAIEVGPLVSGTRVTLRGVGGQPFHGVLRSGDWAEPVDLGGDRTEVSLTIPRGERRQTDIPAVAVVDHVGTVVALSPAAQWFGVSSIGYAVEVVGDPSVPGSARLTEVGGGDAGGDAPFPGAFRIDYDLGSGDRSFRFLTRSMSPNRHPVPIGAYAVCAWVLGDGSGLRLSTRVTGADERVTPYHGPAITWKGWRWVQIPIESGEELRELDGTQGPLVFTAPGTPVKGTLHVSAIGTLYPPNPEGVPTIRFR